MIVWRQSSTNITTTTTTTATTDKELVITYGRYWPYTCLAAVAAKRDDLSANKLLHKLKVWTHENMPCECCMRGFGGQLFWPEDNPSSRWLTVRKAHFTVIHRFPRARTLVGEPKHSRLGPEEREDTRKNELPTITIATDDDDLLPFVLGATYFIIICFAFWHFPAAAQPPSITDVVLPALILFALQMQRAKISRAGFALQSSIDNG